MVGNALCEITSGASVMAVIGAPLAQKVDILHKKLSLNGALCAKPVAGESDGWPLIISSPASIYPDT